MTTQNNHKPRRNKFWELFKDKNGNYNLRELASGLFILIVVVGWIAQQFFSLEFPEYMFYGFISLIASAVFGYSLERKQDTYQNIENDYDPNERNI